MDAHDTSHVHPTADVLQLYVRVIFLHIEYGIMMCLLYVHVLSSLSRLHYMLGMLGSGNSHT